MHTLHVTHYTSMEQDQVLTGCDEVQAGIEAGGQSQKTVMFHNISPAGAFHTVKCDSIVIKRA
jgi:hypothetical protein